MDRPSPIDNIRYCLYRSRRRTISVEVRVSGAIIVRSPMRMPVASIDAFLTDRVPWIVSRLERAAEARVVLPVPAAGEYYLRGELNKTKAHIPGAHRRAEQTTYVGVCGTIRAAYRNMALTYFPTVIAEVLPTMGIHGLRYAGMKLRSMHRRWGSCTGAGIVTLNDRLAMTPDHCIRAVIVHELCHLVYMNHGKAFRDMSRALMPDIDTADADLDRWSALLAQYEPTASAKSRMETKNGAQSPVEERTLLLRSPVYADTFAQSWSNELESADAIISGVRPSM